MRTAGIVLLVLGALMIASGLVQLAVPKPEPPDGELYATQARFDAVIPGGILLAAGFVLVMMGKRPPTIIAVAAEDWMAVTLTPSAGEFALRAIAEHKFPAGTGLRIEQGH